MRERNALLFRRAVPVGVALILLVTAGLVGYFGIEDLGEALAFTGRFTGALFVVAAAVMAVSVIAVLDHWFWRSYQNSGLVVVAGTGLAFMVNSMLLITMIRDAEQKRYLLLWLVLAVGSAWALYASYRADVVIPSPKRFGIAVMATTVVAVADFGYSQLYEPYEQPTHMIFEASLGDPVYTAESTVISLPVDIKIVNGGKVGVYVLATEYQVLGRKAAVRPDGRERNEWRDDAVADYPISLYTDIEYFDLVRKAKFLPTYGEWLNPGEEVNVAQVVEVPAAASYDTMQLRAFAIIARKDRMGLEGGLWFPADFSWEHPEKFGKEVEFIEYRSRIHENNAIAEFAREPRSIAIRQYVNDAELPAIAVLRKGEEYREMSLAEFDDMVTRYGLISITTGWKEKSLRRPDR
ncbi:hypothetical protein HS041_32505 [Planomonospora sp. ID67723]|uniref:hypothetical protein n=1 Tax=Planomonospora sp. ID67723 TaxID=2738134 RepID=UPI0018C4444A|nr:hypothetical protein [Planomonospora sp. ID67723]MBG0832429.1 hypothetical protein [Planomonospora sp. ID67723]